MRTVSSVCGTASQVCSELLVVRSGGGLTLFPCTRTHSKEFRQEHWAGVAVLRVIFSVEIVYKMIILYAI